MNILELLEVWGKSLCSVVLAWVSFCHVVLAECVHKQGKVERVLLKFMFFFGLKNHV
jgi:hypothetical protein